MNSKTSTSRNWDAHVYMVFLPPRDGTQQLRGTNLFMPHLSHGHLHSSYMYQLDSQLKEKSATYPIYCYPIIISPFKICLNLGITSSLDA